MFSRIAKKRMKRIMIFKYVYQLFLVIIVGGIGANIVTFPILLIEWNIEEIVDKFIVSHGYVIPYAIFAFSNVLCNFLSYIPFFKLLTDAVSKDDERAEVIQIERFRINYELNGFFEHNRFWSDAFSRKEHQELLLYDSGGGKYRLNWNENYGSLEEAKKILDCPKVAIRYFKRSKIIFECKILSDEEQIDQISSS